MLISWYSAYKDSKKNQKKNIVIIYFTFFICKHIMHTKPIISTFISK